MAFDATDISTLLSSAHHYYVAVDRVQFKMEALVGLLGVVAGGRRSLPIVLCCSSRDELDSVCSTVSNLSYISLDSLYSDLAEPKRTQILDNFRQATAEWNQSSSVQSVDNKNENEENKSHLIVVTDVCLPLLASGETPLSARVLINYELPTKKEIYVRRMSTCLATDGIVINLVGGGEVVTMRNIEETLGFLIAEMPIEISEIL
ncbi:ATP-dependent RNA helicase eIF4A [Aristolochia californica]|uniref:ATP-dependent RNA helicase eIF4A n=1 Tax=Aristolochia californica TaxID=171875 RepID=UPI0035D9759D